MLERRSSGTPTDRLQAWPNHPPRFPAKLQYLFYGTQKLSNFSRNPLLHSWINSLLSLLLDFPSNVPDFELQFWKKSATSISFYTQNWASKRRISLHPRPLLSSLTLDQSKTIENGPKTSIIVAKLLATFGQKLVIFYGDKADCWPKCLPRPFS